MACATISTRAPVGVSPSCVEVARFFGHVRLSGGLNTYHACHFEPFTPNRHPAQGRLSRNLSRTPVTRCTEISRSTRNDNVVAVRPPGKAGRSLHSISNRALVSRGRVGHASSSASERRNASGFSAARRRATSMTGAPLRVRPSPSPQRSRSPSAAPTGGGRLAISRVHRDATCCSRSHTGSFRRRWPGVVQVRCTRDIRNAWGAARHGRVNLPLAVG